MIATALTLRGGRGAASMRERKRALLVRGWTYMCVCMHSASDNHQGGATSSQTGSGQHSPWMGTMSCRN